MTINGYNVIRSLGKGGMSEVFEVEKASNSSRYALKLFAYHKADDTVRARFVKEGELLMRLNHPRIVRVHDLGIDESGGNPYFVMDLVLDVDGNPCTLADVPAGTADEATVGRWYDDIRDGLSFIHARGIVHRDLKLQNILIGPDGHAVITDFGISKVIDPERAPIDPVDTLVQIGSGHGQLMGSVGYMAPELEMGVAASPGSDWYALGVIVYKLLTGDWCDSRTDVLGMLETYDPVWRRIIPKLLHSNPQGRECLSYSGEKSRDYESAESAREEELLAAAGKMRRLRICLWLSWGLTLAALVTVVWRCAGPEPYVLERLFPLPARDEAETEEFREARTELIGETYEWFRVLEKPELQDRLRELLNECRKADGADQSPRSELLDGALRRLEE